MSTVYLILFKVLSKSESADFETQIRIRGFVKSEIRPITNLNLYYSSFCPFFLFLFFHSLFLP